MAIRKEDVDIDIAAVGKAMYEGMRSRLETTEKGTFVVIDVYSKDYEIDSNHTSAIRRLTARHPQAITYTVRIGYPTAFKMGIRSSFRKQ